MIELSSSVHVDPREFDVPWPSEPAPPPVRAALRCGQNGLLANIGDADGFANAFTKILHDSILAKMLIAGGERSLMGQFSEEAVANAYLRLFASHRTSSDFTRSAA